jgi:hypothetical protein
MNGPEGQEAKVVVLEDGHEWLSPRTWEDVVAAGILDKVVACKEPVLPMPENPYRIDQSDIYFSLISDSLLDDNAAYASYPCITQGPNQACSLSSALLRHLHGKFFVRLLTFHEMCHLSEAREKGEFVCPNPWCGEDDLLQDDLFPKKGEFTLDNLMEKERPKYFRNQVRKKMWPWQRLLLIGKKDTGSALYNVPKDIIGLLTQHVFNAQLSELMKNAKPDQKLDLE